MPTEIAAAGGLVWRRRASGSAVAERAINELGYADALLIHRPRYDDWSLPKGKLKAGEHPILGALREVLEETGVRARVGERLPTTDYPIWSEKRGDGSGGPGLLTKRVDYWAMTVQKDLGFVPGSEVDEIAWVPVTSAASLLSYAHDVRVVEAFANLAPQRGIALLVEAQPTAKLPTAKLRGGFAPLAELGRLISCYAPNRLVDLGADSALAHRLGAELDLVPVLSAEPNWTTANELAGLITDAHCVLAVVTPDKLRMVLSATVSGLRSTRANCWAVSIADQQVVAADPVTL